ncbi:MAG: hypothetical protein OZSIB_2920 [Candidatus Ozemobacter sibiricus]|uniref:Uncharacterized protein n=1 Tax=Candidatus Ozemobacter sibiricus TaxID=2268124 RepID=A0A367ZRX3_9BACT|nr:MAG: hypothetical protein OZSIB_2920 [Candidatus Ozemobacter sibiricus]
MRWLALPGGRSMLRCDERRPSVPHPQSEGIIVDLPGGSNVRFVTRSLVRIP